MLPVCHLEEPAIGKHQSHDRNCGHALRSTSGDANQEKLMGKTLDELLDELPFAMRTRIDAKAERLCVEYRAPKMLREWRSKAVRRYRNCVTMPRQMAERSA